MMRGLPPIRPFVARHPVAVANSLAVVASLLDVVSTAYAIQHPRIVEGNPVIAYGITVGWHYVLFQKLAGLAMTGMAAHLLFRRLARFSRPRVASALRWTVAFPAALYLLISASNLRLGILAGA